MKTLLTAVVLIVAMNAVSQEDQHLEGQVKDKEMNGIDKVSELVAGSVLEVEVYPNLSDGNVFVKGKEGSVVTLYSLSGTYVGTWIINAEEKVAITDLPEGSYLCSLNNNGTRVVKRFVVLFFNRHSKWCCSIFKFRHPANDQSTYFVKYTRLVERIKHTVDVVKVLR